MHTVQLFSCWALFSLHFNSFERFNPLMLTVCNCEHRWNVMSHIIEFIEDPTASRYKRKLNERLTFNNYYSSVYLKRELSSKAFVVWLLIDASFSQCVVLNFGETSEFHVNRCILYLPCFSLKLLSKVSQVMPLRLI